MMDISKMSDQEKSVLLAKAMGWKTPLRKDMDDPKPLIIPPEGDGILWADSLYDPVNMALAWRVLNWAYTSLPVWKHEKYLTEGQQWESWFVRNIELGEPNAQRLWLAKILELAIETGIIEEEAMP